MMNIFLSTTAIVLSLCLSAGLIRIYLGPSTEDRMMAVQLMGTMGVALLLVLATQMNLPSGIDLALVLALLATVSVVGLTRRTTSMVQHDD